MPLAFRLARREMRGGLRGFGIFLACLTIGVAAIAGVGSLAAAIDAGLKGDARIVLGGDVEFNLVNRSASAAQLAALAGGGTVSEAAQLRAMARRSDGESASPVRTVQSPSTNMASTFGNRTVTNRSAHRPARKTRLPMKASLKPPVPMASKYFRMFAGTREAGAV